MKSLREGAKLLERAFEAILLVTTINALFRGNLLAEVLTSVGGLLALMLSYLAFSKLTDYDKKYSIGKKGVVNTVAGMALILLSAPLPAPLSALIFGVGLLLFVEGGIMYIVALWRLGGERRGERIRSGIFLELTWLIITLITFIIVILFVPSLLGKVVLLLYPIVFLAQIISLVLIIIGLRGIASL